jgi:hypothetical protein
VGILFGAFTLKAFTLAGWRLATNHDPEENSNLPLAFASTVILIFGPH